MIKKTQDNTKDHVSDTKDDGDFHLQRIGECQLVARQLPNLKKKQIIQKLVIFSSKALTTLQQPENISNELLRKT